MKPVPKFQIEAIKVYPTGRPEEAREVETPPQTAKLDKISEVGLEPELVERIRKVER